MSTIQDKNIDSNIQDNTVTDNKSAPAYDSVTNNIVVAALYNKKGVKPFETISKTEQN